MAVSSLWLLAAVFGVGGWLVATAVGQVGWRARLTEVGKRVTADERATDLVAAAGGAAAGALAAGWLTASPLWAVAALGLGGWGARTWLRASRKSGHAARLLQQKLLLPEFLDLVAISVGAGLGLRQSISAAVARCHPLLAAPWQPLADDADARRPLALWLDEIMRSEPDSPSSRVASHLLIATERGTPVAAALAALSQEFRSESRRELLEQAARKDVQMMLPVVFGILPSVTVVALYPALTTLSALN